MKVSGAWMVGYRAVSPVVLVGDEGFGERERSWRGQKQIVLKVLDQADDFAAVKQFLRR